MNYRYCARVLLEVTTPLKIGTGETGLNTDELAATDANGLPIIPGTSLTGVLRHSFGENKAKELFGFQEDDKGKGSRLIVTNANFVGKEGTVVDGLRVIDFKDTFYSKFKMMAVRDHARITHKGIADSQNHGKFDTQVVYKGCRFVFDLELKGDENDEENWKEIISKLSSPLFRIGSGTRKGFGELKIIKMDQEKFDLAKNSEGYMNRSAKLTIPKNNYAPNALESNKYHLYELRLTADDFFIFSSGYGDREVDAIAKKEPFVIWQDGIPHFTEDKVLLPATSVKGAIAHRTAFHYNRLTGNFADEIDTDKYKDYVGENNPAVKELFGFAKDSNKYEENEGEKHGRRGRVIFSDLFVDNAREKIFNHVAIDRFTGGAIDGALFDEKVIHTNEQLMMKIVVEKAAFSFKNVKEAFECALKDITTGMLPLGGNVMRGHGCFNGSVTRNGEAF